MPTRLSSRTSEHELHGETSEDLDELCWHIDHLQTRLGALPAIADSPLGALHLELAHRLDALGAALHGAPGASPLVHHQGGLRQLYQALAVLETTPEWHSAPGSLSEPIRDLAPLSHVPGFNDYQRGYLPWLRTREHHALRTAQPALTGRAMLFSSGMGAIQTALQLVLGRAKRLLLGTRVYYETQTLLALTGARDRLLPLDEADLRMDVLVDKVRAVDSIFVDTVTLDRAALPIDVAQLYRAIDAAGRTGIAVVLDNTAPGPALALPQPPPGIQLYVVESLLKNYQAGLDLAASGMLIVVASPDAALDPRLVHDLEVLRSTNGTNLSAYNARLVPLVPRERILSRLRRQARNAAILADRVRDRCEVSQVGPTGLVFCGHPRAAQLLSVIELLCLARGVRMTRGTSFGFNDTRVALVPGLEDQLRFACGMAHAAAATDQALLVCQALDAVDDPGVRAACVPLTRFFPDYPRRATSTPEEIDGLRRHAQELDRRVVALCGASR